MQFFCILNSPPKKIHLVVGQVKNTTDVNSLFSLSSGFAGTMMQVFFALSIALLGFLAYLIRDWRNLTIAASLPTIFALLIINHVATV